MDRDTQPSAQPGYVWNQGTPVFSPPAYFPDQIQDWAIWLWLELVRTCFSFLLFSPPSPFGKCWHFSKGLKTQTLNIFHWKTLGERERNNPQTANNQISFAFKAFGFLQGKHIWRSGNTFMKISVLSKPNFSLEVFQLAPFSLVMVWTLSTSNFGKDLKKI